MITGDDTLHVIFLPFFASSHIIPLVHAARLFAARGVRSTILTTVHNALIIQSSLTHDIISGHPITVHTLNFPASELGLPIGIENINSAPTNDISSKVFRGMVMLQTQMEQVIRELVPDCIFSDMFFPWTVDVADELDIPRLLFYPSCFLYHSVFHSLKAYEPHNKVNSETEWFVVPNLPDEIVMKRSQVSRHLKTKTGYGEMIERVHESEKRSYGLVHNTFYELEPGYVEHFKKIKGLKVWHIGPVFRFFVGDDDVGVSKRHDCLRWLDDHEPESVIYVCFGSMVKFPEAQITEIALALEESKKPFIWVVKKGGDDQRVEGIPKGFEERIRKENKGLIVTGWAPQVEILRHEAVGGFVTHCGWNSVLEAAASGVPLVTWPLYAEHFYNEKLVELLGIGVGVGADVWNSGFEITSPIIEKRAFRKAIELLTSESTIAKSIRQNSKKLALKAKMVVEEGGSSVNSLTALIDELKSQNYQICPKALITEICFLRTYYNVDIMVRLLIH